MGKIKKLLKKVVSKGVSAVKEATTRKSIKKNIQMAAAGAVKSKSGKNNHGKTYPALKKPGATYSLGTSIKLKDRKKSKQKKKIAKWESDKKNKPSEQSKFLAMDKKNKNKNK